MKNISRSKHKLKTQQLIETIGEAFPHQNLQQLLNWLYAKQTEFISKGFSNIELKFDGGSWDDKYEMAFYGVREETDGEFKERMKEVDRQKKIETDKLNRHRQFIEEEAKKLGLLA